MEGVVWLSRETNAWHGRYNVSYDKPVLKGYEWEANERLLVDLCPSEVKKWFGLTNHLRKGTCRRIVLKVNADLLPTKVNLCGH